MPTEAHFVQPKGQITRFVVFALVFCILMLQVGLSYYVSFQIAALLIIFFVIVYSGGKLINIAYVFGATFIFCLFLALTALNLHVAISENSENLLLTFIGVIGYTFMMLMVANLKFKRPDKILYFFGKVSSMTICLIAFLIALTDLSIVPMLTRENLILQNITLVTNFTSFEVLAEEFKYLDSNGLKPDMDLFYGEQSFLALVVFACVICKIICGKLLLKYNLQPITSSQKSRGFRIGNFIESLSSTRTAIVLGLGIMIYIKSFSALFYVMIVIISLTIANRRTILRAKLGFGKILVILVAMVFLAIVAWSSLEYYVHRVTTVLESVSLNQRFSSIQDFGLQDYFLGIDNALKIPEAGFHNGILYIIAISGFGGLFFIFILIFRAYILAHRIGLSLLVILFIIGVFSQNGSIFSPNKVVILSLVMIPLACTSNFKPL